MVNAGKYSIHEDSGIDFRKMMCNLFLIAARFDEALRNASCRAASGSDAIEHRDLTGSDT